MSSSQNEKGKYRRLGTGIYRKHKAGTQHLVILSLHKNVVFLLFYSADTGKQTIGPGRLEAVR